MFAYIERGDTCMLIPFKESGMSPLRYREYVIKSNVSDEDKAFAMVDMLMHTMPYPEALSRKSIYQITK